LASTPAKVPDAIIEEIRTCEHNGAIEIPRCQLKAGDRVRILTGPFCGHLAIYTGMSGLERVAVLLQILGPVPQGPGEPESDPECTHAVPKAFPGYISFR
jgi:hypothetical protein